VKYIAQLTFTVGDFGEIRKGDMFSFEDGVLTHDGKTMSRPNVRVSIESGWAKKVCQSCGMPAGTGTCRECTVYDVMGS
jgi:hypothetical protein